MLKPLILGAIVVAAMPAAAVAKDGAPETLTRTGKWEVNYDPDGCHLSAQFGAGEDLMLMRLTPYQPSDWFDLVVYGERLATEAPRSDATVDFGLGGEPLETGAVNGKAGKLPLAMLGSMRLDGWRRSKPEEDGPPLTPQQEAAVTGVTVRIQGKKPFRLQFGSLARPMEQLRLCQTELVRSWGYDPAVQAALARPVRPATPAATWLSWHDYPSNAVLAGQNGTVQFRLDVEANGKISDCHVLARTKPDVFADTTCRIVTKRAKLEPARDADGKPVRSFYVQKVSWRVE